jgi:hypothetical protein
LPILLEDSAVLRDKGANVLAVKSEGVDDFLQQSANGLAVAFECEDPIAPLARFV